MLAVGMCVGIRGRRGWPLAVRLDGHGDTVEGVFHDADGIARVDRHKTGLESELVRPQGERVRPPSTGLICTSSSISGILAYVPAKRRVFHVQKNQSHVAVLVVSIHELASCYSEQSPPKKGASHLARRQTQITDHVVCLEVDASSCRCCSRRKQRREKGDAVEEVDLSELARVVIAWGSAGKWDGHEGGEEGAKREEPPAKEIWSQGGHLRGLEQQSEAPKQRFLSTPPSTPRSRPRSTSSSMHSSPPRVRVLPCVSQSFLAADKQDRGNDETEDRARTQRMGTNTTECMLWALSKLSRDEMMTNEEEPGRTTTASKSSGAEAEFGRQTFE
ncbi:hypothetical protein B0H14DRAFT_2594614 [Mycena olivaceomarginata]|nr:hypothetical protein B0H14DRAFT_2594614 [Mycena olivaceomarginata]